MILKMNGPMKKPSFDVKNFLIKYISAYDLKSIHFKLPLLFAFIYTLIAISIVIYKIALPSIENAYLSVAVIEIITVAFPPIIYLKLHQSKTSTYAFRPFSPDKSIIILLSSLAMIFGSIAITVFLSRFGIVESSSSVYDNFYLPTVPNRLSYILFASFTFALIPAICEEFLCRGLLFSEFEKHGTIPAVIISAVLFSMMHFSLGKFPLYFFCGILLGFLRAITNSAFASLVAHFIYNMFSLFYQQFFGELTEQFNEFTIIFFIALGLCFLTLFFMFGEADRIYNSYARKNILIKGAYKKASLSSVKNTLLLFLTSPSFIICIILYFLFSIIF